MGNEQQKSPTPPSPTVWPYGSQDIVLRIGGSTLSGAIGGAALASIGGPIATVVGCVVGGLAGAAVSTANVKADRAGKR